MKADLRDVTICAADSVNMPLSARALQLSMAQCDFADAILFSHAPVEGSFRSITIDRLQSMADYSNFMTRQLPNAIDTPFVLVIQWDGYVVDPAAWSPAFRDYDYIGAKWLWPTDTMTVGNGGFSLRSRKLLRALTDMRMLPIPNVNEDVLICRGHRLQLERDYGIRFAPEKVADRFSYEESVPDAPTFGFHGVWNMWRHTDDAAMIRLLPLLDPYVFPTLGFVLAIAQYFMLRKFEPLRAFYAKARAHLDEAKILQYLKYAFDENAAAQCLALCKELTQPSAAAEMSFDR